ncbi:MAG: efflux RND transporter periplasmic adaptor subunit, partial [Pseudomonadales bacterium]
MPVYPQEENADGPGTVSIDPHVVNNLGVRTEPVIHTVLEQDIKTVGYVEYDETQLDHLHTRLPGWIRKLYANSEGQKISAGDPLYELYSPELVTAQEEYLIARRSGSRALERSARAKLLALAVSERDIQALITRGEALQSITHYAQRSGYLKELNVRQGMYVTPSQTLMGIGSLQSVWVVAEVLERQVPWLSAQADASLYFEYYPGQVWRGGIDYIYPTLDAQTRARKVRLRFDNPREQLRPGMFADVTLRSPAGGAVLHIPSSALIRTA